ncbi:MAG: hypothetical protein KDE04_20800, partial [Anaerolineales bacterium]|nr:hypothetical protein [Anaerolineales bacterium]
MRAVLDRPDLFDLLNLHALAQPTEIEAMLNWLHYETGQRGYHKPIIISDTAPNLLVGWGSATSCDGPANRQGTLLPPATAADRCALATIFNNLIDRDEASLEWAWRFAAEDMVKKVVIAADHGVALINTAFSEDLYWQQLRAFQAGAGLSAWAGLLDLTLTRPRPGFYALQQLNRQLTDYPTVTRLLTGDPDIWLYELCDTGVCRWLIWYEPDQLQLPGSPALTRSYTFTTTASNLISEPLALGAPATLQTSALLAANGSVTLTLTTTPQYLYPWGGVRRPVGLANPTGQPTSRQDQAGLWMAAVNVNRTASSTPAGSCSRIVWLLVSKLK